MINFYPFLYRFGVSFNYEVSENIIDSIVEFIDKRYNIDVNLPQRNNTYCCIAIKDDEAKDNTLILSEKFNERLKEYSIQDYDNSIFFLDLKDAYSDKFIDGILINSIIQLIKTNKIKNSIFPNFILLVEDLDGSLIFDNLFTNHFEYSILNFCFVFDKNGKYINRKNLKIEQDFTLIDLVNKISKSNLEKFDFKLVRKINHFKKFENNRWNACQHFFYEIMDDGDETFQLLKDELYLLKANPHYIVYDTRNSNWLEKSIISFTNTISSNRYGQYSNYTANNLLNINDPNWETKILKEKLDIIFISDLIHTGKTFKNSYRKLSKKFPNSNILCLSALVTEYAFAEGSGNADDRKITINNISIRYFKKVKQIFAPRTTTHVECKLCKYNLLPPVETSIKISKDLSTYEMWLMAEEAGYKIEDFPPRGGRKKIIIPNSLELFKKNGALLALKFQEHIKDLGIYSNEIVIIFPDERNESSNGVKQAIEDTPSGYFAKCLKFYNNNFNYLAIPRTMIRSLDESKENWESVKRKYPDVVKQIEDIDENSPIIIIDEVNVTGRTFKTIVDILENLGKNIECYFPIFNFNSSDTDVLNQSSEERYKNIHFLSLYKLEMNYGTN